MLSKNLKKWWKDPGYRRRQSLSHKRAWKTRGTRGRLLKGRKKSGKRISVELKKSWATPSVRRRRMQIVRSARYRRLQRKRTRASWKRDREKRLTGIRKATSSKSYQRTHSKIMSKVCATDKYRKMMRKVVQERYKDPEYAARHRAAMRAPERRKRCSESAKKRWADGNKAGELVSALARACAIRKPKRPELAMQKLLKKLKLKFLFCARLGRFIPDFTLKTCKLIIQCDGDYWHSLPEVKDRDRRSNKTFKKAGYSVLRFSETDIKKFPEKVEKEIVRRVKELIKRPGR